MTQLRLTIPGEPVAKGRPRARVVHQGGFARAILYTPPETERAEEQVARIARVVYRGAPLTGPLSLHVEAVFAVRASWSGRRRAAALGQPHVQRPDADNILKLIADALNGVVYGDDAQLAAQSCAKRWGQVGRVEITVTAFAPAEADLPLAEVRP